MAEQGSYRDLSRREGGAFTKLMEWQMSGGEGVGGGGGGGKDGQGDFAVSGEGGRGPPTEKEEIQLRLDEGESEGESEGGNEEANVVEGSKKVHEVVESAVQKGGRK